MRKQILRLSAAVLVLCLLLSGCSMERLADYYNSLQQELYGPGTVAYSDMTYTRPDMTELEETLEAACRAAQGDDLDTIIEAIYDFYDAYDLFYTNYYLADIRYSCDLTDSYWEAEYTYCQGYADTADAALEELYYALADSPCREELEGEEYFGSGYFDSYDGENLWTDEFLSLLEREAALQSRYYALCEEALAYEQGSEEYYNACGDEMAQVLVDLIALRQQMAAGWGYEDYAQFAFDFYYYRDYTPVQMTDYLEQIRRELVPVYIGMDYDVWDAAYRRSSESDTLDYCRSVAESMGGTVLEAFELMETAGLYDISYGENKYNASFEVWLPSYYEPFVFINPTRTAYDKLTLVHEFGHFCNDYACYGSYAGIDVMEFFSQGMEYLSLCLGEDGEDLTRLKLADSLCVYVEQAAYAAFEQQMYCLTGDELTVQNLKALYFQTAQDYGFDTSYLDPREFVDITHYYTNPMYIVSYIVSNDAAMQLYQLEQGDPGAGRKLYQDNLTSQEAYFLAFVDSAGLESPLAEGRIETVRKIFEDVLLP